MVKDLLMVGIGGFFGSIARYFLSTIIIGTGFSYFPLGTCTVNALGSFIIGIMLASISSGTWFYIGVVGFCGGFTTFSTFSAELFQMIRSENYLNALGYATFSIVVCLATVALGIYLGGKLNLKIE